MARRTRTPGGEAIDLEARRRTRRRASFFRHPLAALIVLGGCIAVAGVASSMRIQEVRVVGLRTLSPSVVAEATGLRGGERLFLTRLTTVRARVEEVPEIRRAEVRRRLPGGVVVQVEERVALVRLANRNERAADRDGRVMRAGAGAGLPELAGWRGKGDLGGRLDAASRDVLASYALLPDRFRLQVGQIVLGDGLTMVLRDGVRVMFGEPTDMAAKAVAATAVRDEAAASKRVLEYIDVRAPRTPVAKEVAPATPVPKASARPAAGSSPKASPKATARPSPRVSPASTSRPSTPRPTPRPTQR